MKYLVVYHKYLYTYIIIFCQLKVSREENFSQPHAKHNLFKSFAFISFMCVGDHENQKVTDPLELELQMVVDH